MAQPGLHQHECRRGGGGDAGRRRGGGGGRAGADRAPEFDCEAIDATTRVAPSTPPPRVARLAPPLPRAVSAPGGSARGAEPLSPWPEATLLLAIASGVTRRAVAQRRSRRRRLDS